MTDKPGQDLIASEEAVQLSVTIYMVGQAVAPLIIGANTDRTGRKFSLLFTLVLYLGACVGLFLLPNATEANKQQVYAGLLLLRLLQSCGSAVFSIASGIVADIFPASQRAGAIGILNAGSSVGPALSPTLGALLTAAAGWRTIFLFCLTLAGFCFALLLFLLPETLRLLVGNGSKPAPTWAHESMLSLILQHTVSQRTGQPRPGLPLPWGNVEELDATPDVSALQRRTRLLVAKTKQALSLAPLRLLLKPQALCCFLGYGLPFAAQFMILSTVSENFQTYYNYSVIQAGLVFLASGGGTCAAAFVAGRLMDWYFARSEQRVVDARASNSALVAAEASSGTPCNTTTTAHGAGSLSNDHHDRDGLLDPRDPLFPLERARLFLWPYAIGMHLGAVVGYGWSVGRVPAAVPVVLLGLNGASVGTLNSLFSTAQMDYLPNQGASVAAAANFVRCALGAIGTAAIQPLLRATGPGCAYVVVAMLPALSVPSTIVLLVRGRKWREQTDIH